MVELGLTKGYKNFYVGSSDNATVKYDKMSFGINLIDLLSVKEKRQFFKKSLLIL